MCSEWGTVFVSGLSGIAACKCGGTDFCHLAYESGFLRRCAGFRGKRAQMLEAAKEGRVIAGKAHAKKQQKEGNLKGWGASVFLQRKFIAVNVRQNLES